MNLINSSKSVNIFIIKKVFYSINFITKRSIFRTRIRYFNERLIIGKKKKNKTIKTIFF